MAERGVEGEGVETEIGEEAEAEDDRAEACESGHAVIFAELS